MARPSSRSIPRVALAPPSTPAPENQRRLAFSRINNIVTGVGVSNPAPVDSNNNSRHERFRIFISVINYNDRRSATSNADPTVANTRRIERSVRNRSAASRPSQRPEGARGRSARRAEREQQEEEEEEEDEVDSEDDEFTSSRRSSRRRGKCDHNHALEKSFCSKCHIRRRHLCRWWCRQQYRRQV
ncbi:uncharacterized protein LOC100678455 [Nasonia vitripennis]|uniref:Uncharacterized protein n=1 Tax=Nasonia vitripennis TaxID=7425 RepID=A0A7M7QIY6_NASVI|nr:uncharacterized protein LOC100678455 [Nasonia vitripennis]